MALLVVDQHVHFDSRCVVRTKSCLSSPMMIVMMRSGESGLVGYGGRSTANAFEAKIDNRIAAIARELFVFIRKTTDAFNRLLRRVRRIFRCYRRTDRDSLFRGEAKTLTSRSGFRWRAATPLQRGEGGKPPALSTDCAKGEAESVGHGRFDHAHEGHFQSRRPPRTQGDKRFHCPDNEMRHYTDGECGDHGRHSRHEEKWNDRDECTDRGGDRGRGR